MTNPLNRSIEERKALGKPVMYEIAIKVDTNDADYKTELSPISQEELDYIMPLIEAIKLFKPYETECGTYRAYKRSHQHNYPVENCCREDLGEKTVQEYYSDISQDVHETFYELCPWDEYGFHTIHSITITPLVKKEELL